MSGYLQHDWAADPRPAADGKAPGVYVSAFGLTALPAALLQVWWTTRTQPAGALSTAWVLTLVALGILGQWLLGSAVFHSIYTRYGQDRHGWACGRLWSTATPALCGVAYGWSCALYLAGAYGHAEVLWSFPAYLLLGSAIPSVVFLCLTREDLPPRPPECPACRYILFYATQQRCPECGRTFHLGEIDTSVVDLDAQGVLQPKPGATDRIHWPTEDQIRRERHWRRLRHPVTALLVATYAILIFNIAAPKLNSPGAWELWMVLGAALLVQTMAIVMVLYQEVRRYVLRHGLAGRACLVAVIAAWITLLNMTVRLSS